MHKVHTYLGTSSNISRLSFLLVPLAPCDLDTGCALHPGFFLAWGEISGDVQAALDRVVALHGSYAIVVTGHSLGGAGATIAGAYIRNGGWNLDLYTYGSPRVGNLAFVARDGQCALERA